MSVSAVRNLLCWMMCALFPLSLFAADTGSAMLHSKGGVWVNGQEVPDSTAVFLKDEIETKTGSVANLEIAGSTVLIQSESIITLGDNFLNLEHGSVSVGTSTELRVKVNCLTVIPVVNQWTQYDVTDMSGTVKVFAQKLDVNITQGGHARKSSDDNDSASATVREGAHASRDESVLCGGAEKPPGPAGGHPLSTQQLLEIGGGAGGAGLLCILLCRGSSPTSVSTSSP